MNAFKDYAQMDWKPIDTLVYDDRPILVLYNYGYHLAKAHDPKETGDWFFSRVSHYAELPPKPSNS
jgi:hypothetical protein